MNKAVQATPLRLDPLTLRRTLGKTFGLTSLRNGQEAVVASVLAGQDTLAIMPTGAGKSLCYQLAGVLLPGLSVIVSPLISLMKDQVAKLSEMGIEAAQVNSAVTAREEDEALRDISESRSEFVFITPERLADPEFLATLAQQKVGLFVVDEAHCISQWGHDFRPAFLEIPRAIEVLGRPTVLALTATASREVAQDVIEHLSPRGMHVVRTGLYRPNLHFAVKHVTSDRERIDSVRRLVAQLKGSGIIYTATVKAADELVEALREAGEPVARYHGRLASAERHRNQDAFMSGEQRVMVATNAFGMGIDKPDIRFVLHYQVPGSIDAYYQEAGRAGRDGEAAQCVLFYHLEDSRIHRFFLAGRYPSLRDMLAVCAALAEANASGGAADLPSLEKQLEGKVAQRKVQLSLRLLVDAGVAARTGRGRYRLGTDVATDEASLDALLSGYRGRSEHDRQVLERVLHYAQTGLCRWKTLLTYFGESVEWESCGSCDNCRRLLRTRPKPGNRPALRQPRKTVSQPAWRVGLVVRVPRYGQGEVTQVAGDVLSVRFPDGSTRDFLNRYVDKVNKGEGNTGDV